MDVNYLPFHPSPSKPKFQPPPGAIDAHCHVFGPRAKFPYAPERKYTPCDAPKEKLFELRDFLGFSRNVIVQASCHGNDNAALVDALKSSNGRAKGIASIGATTTDAALAALNEAGVRGIRFSFLRRLVDTSTPHELLLTTARRVAKFGWHIVIYFEAHDLDTIEPLLKAIPTQIVLDHMSVPDVSKGVGHDDWQRYLTLIDENKSIWVKVTCPERISKNGPPYEDFLPFARSLTEHFIDRILWGTDWPHPNMATHAPDDGALVDIIPKFAPTPTLQKILLVDNPMRLYWPEQRKC